MRMSGSEVVLLFLICTVCGFEVKHGPAARELDLRVDNTELLDCAALTGENRTAEITRESQLVISQHGVFLSLDCSSLLPAPSPGRPPPTVMWTRQSQPNEETVPLLPGGDLRIQLLSASNSILRLSPTNILVGAERDDGGDYTCKVCTTGPELQLSCQSRSTTLFLIGSGPKLEEFGGCERRLDTLVCEVGTNVSIPHTIDPDTGERSLDIKRLVITCNPSETVLPTPSYTWTKDGTVVVRDASRRSTALMIADEFLMQGNNSLLLLIEPPPLMFTSSLSIQVDFTATSLRSNMTGIMGVTLPGGGMTTEDILRFILESTLGDWQCITRNTFGNDSRTSTVFVETNCTNGCRNCSGLGMCVDVDTRCQCICPPGYMQDSFSSCEDIDECANNQTHNCSSENSLCVNTEGAFNCTCEEGFVSYSGDNTLSCLDCRLGMDLQHGRVEFVDKGAEVVAATASCDDGFSSPPEPVLCRITTSSSGEVGVIREGELVCLREQDAGGCGKSCYIPVVMGAVILLLLLLALLVLVLVIYFNCNLSHGYVVTV